VEDPNTSLTDSLRAWALALFELYLAHPWLTERPWSQATQGPNEQDWLERLLQVLHGWDVPPIARPSAVTMLYATVRATAGAAAAYRRLHHQGIAEWRGQAEATMKHIPDLCERYPLSTGLEPITPQWQDNPRAGLVGAVGLLAQTLSRTGHSGTDSDPVRIALDR
jgi:hypothetical protein